VADPTRGFVNDGSTGVENWRGIVLFGRNVASYKFALAKSLLEVAAQGHEAVALADLAVPFSSHICEHLTHAAGIPPGSSSRNCNNNCAR
tara:strand:+ start:20 stop:289 length:270 start_codon:yes stop_codon:yes gene_type:complete